MPSKKSRQFGHTIGLILEGVENDYQSSLYMAAEYAAALRGIRLICFTGSVMRAYDAKRNDAHGLKQ